MLPQKDEASGRSSFGPGRFVATLAAVAAAVLVIKLAVVAGAGVVEGEFRTWLTGLAGVLLMAALTGLVTGFIVGHSLRVATAVPMRHAVVAGLLVGGVVFAWDLILDRSISSLALPMAQPLAVALTAGSLCIAALPTAAWVMWLGMRESQSEDEDANADYRPHIIILAGMLALLGFFAVVSFATVIAWVPERVYLQAHADILNAAGRQRMLSQQIARYAALGDVEHNTSAAQLSRSVDRLKDEAERLDAALGEVSPSWERGGAHAAELLRNVQAKRQALLDRVDQFLTINELRGRGVLGVNPPLQRASDDLLRASERLVDVIQQETSAAFERTAATIRNLGLLLSFILVMGAMSIILPVAWIVRRQHRRLRHHALVLATSRDETRRALRELEAYQTALDQRVIVAITDRKGVIIHVNNRFCEISGYTRCELVGQTHRIVNSGRHSRAFFQDMWRTIARGDCWQGEICNVTKEGLLYWVDTTIVPLCDDGGRIARYLAIRYDVTAHRLAQQALHDSEAHLKRAQAVASVGSWTLDLATDELRWSEETYRMFGLSPDMPLSFDQFFELVHPDDREAVDEAWRRGVASGSYSVEHRILVGGEVRHVHERADFEHDDAGRPIRATGTVQDVTDRKRAEAQVLWQANYDALTGLPNRRLFQSRLEEALRATSTSGSAGAVIMVDLDHFKTVNDTLGHKAGDAVLVEAARRLTANLRDGDMVGRFGGDEFLILVHRIDDRADAGFISEAVQAALTQPFTVEGREMFLAASVGICVFPDDSDQLDEILQYADAAMYEAKKAGRETVRFFTRRMHKENLERLSIIEDLRGAIERDELELHYQPIVAMPSALIDKCEALVRWRHPKKGLLAPGRFIPVAESYGLIAPLSEWVVAEAARQQHAWRRQGLDLQISLNLSADHVRFDGLTDRLIETIRGWDATGSIVLELTESLLINDEFNQFDRLERIAEAGIGIAIDDFGTGYSSLSYLARIPARYLKIDRAFIAKLDMERERRLVTAIIGIGQDLGMSVVAEGIETSEQVAFLIRKRCNYAQGFYFSKPLPPDELFAFATDHGLNPSRLMA